MAEAEAEAEGEAEARGEQPFLVSSCAPAGFLRGSPMLNADGELVSRADRDAPLCN